MESIILKKIDDFTSNEFDQVLNIYSVSFPPVETKPVEKILDLLKGDDYHLYIAMEKSKVLGFSLLYVFNDLKIGLLDYTQSQFFKDKISENQMFLVNIGLQIRPAKVVALNPLKISLGKPAVFDKNDICVILKPESQTIRIVGSGAII